MTLLEYTQSLQQQKNPELKPEQIFAKAQEWKKNNPQPKVEEKVDTDNKFKKDGTLNPEAFKGESKVVAQKVTGEYKEPEVKQEEKVENTVVKPGSVITDRNDGYEYKFDINPNDKTKGVYYSRKKGTENWVNASDHDGSDQARVAEASIANLFGHSDFDESKRNQYFNALKKQKEDEIARKKEALKQKNIDDEKGVIGLLKEGKIGEAAARGAGESVEGLMRGYFNTYTDYILEPIAGALNFVGVIDADEMGIADAESLTGVKLNDMLDNIVTDYGLKDQDGVTYDFEEETGDMIEQGILNIGMGIMAAPKLIADTKQVIAKGVNKILPKGAADLLQSPVMKSFVDAVIPGMGLVGSLSNKDLVEGGEIAYEQYKNKSEELGLTLADFGEVGIGETFSDSFKNLSKGDLDQALGAFVTASSRVTSSALGSLPSVAQSMIPYVGIASIVVGEAAKANKESSDEGYELDYKRLGHAYIIGASEGLLEYTTKKIGGRMFQSLRGGSKEVIDKTLRQYGVEVLKDFGAEGLSETATLLINQAANYIYKDDVDNFFPAFSEVVDTFLIGGVMGGGMGSVTAGSSLLRSTIQHKDVRKSLANTKFKSLGEMFDNANPLSDIDKNSTLTKEEQDESSNSTFDLLINPSTESFLNTELKRKVESGDMTTDKSNEIKSNFKARQKAANTISSLNLTGSNRLLATDLMLEKQNLQETIKETDDAFNVENKDRLQQINTELSDIYKQSQVATTAEAIAKGDRKGQAIADQLGINYTAGDQATVDNKIKELKDKGGKIDEKNSTNYGSFLTMPDGSKEIIINNEVAAEDRVVTTAQHEILHGVLKQSFDNNPQAVIAMGKSLISELNNNPGIEVSQDFTNRLNQYEADLNNGVIDEATYFEEAMTLTSEGISDGSIKVNETSLMKLGDIFRRALSALGINVTFKSGNDVLNFIRDYNKSFEKGKLDRGQRKIADKGVKSKIETKDTITGRTITKESKRLSQATQTYMELDNNILQQALISAIENNSDQQYPIAEAITEKNWGLMSPLLNINSQQEMNAAKEIVIDQLLGNFEGSGQGKYSARNTSLLAGFSLDPDGDAAQVSTYLTKTIRTRKPEIDAAIADRTGRSGQELQQAGGEVVTETETIDTTKLAKKPSETTGLEPETETRITEAVQKVYKGKDVKFSETRNIPKEVADIYGEEFGINPQTITDKTRNFQKTDADGLTKAKQFLLKNAKDDFARLPKTKDDFGKGTFIPKNVRDALYTDGELTGSLKDYMDLIRTKPEKVIYRDRVGQTIRGLLGLHIRNRMLETAQPSQAKRVQSGAKFSKRRKPNAAKLEEVSRARTKNDTNNIVGTKTEVSDSNRKKIQDQVQDSIEKYGLNENTFDAARFNNSGAQRTRMPNGNVVYKLTNGKTIPGIPNGKNKNGVKQFKQPTLVQIEKIHGKGVTLVAARNRLYYGASDPAYIKAKEAAKKNNKVNQPKFKRVTVKNAFTDKGKKQAKINQDVLENTSLQLEKAVSSGMPLSIAGIIIEGAYQATTGLIKVAAPFKYKSNKFEYAEEGKASDKQGNKYREEHTPPASVIGGSLLLAIKNGTVKQIMPLIKDNYMQVQLSKKDDSKIDKANLDSMLPEQISILTPNSGVIRFAAADIDLNSITNPITGKTMAQEIGIPISDKNNINLESIHYQNELIIKSKGEITSLDKQKLKSSLPVQNLKSTQTVENSNNFSDVISSEQRSEQQKDVMIKSLETKINASRLDSKRRGISVFDFDDTLARTKEKVIVNMPDGSIDEISASEFAKTAGDLQSQGAEFDFINFENVARETKEGPLADLARKRQDKFGSGDIFILTARPNSAGPAIKQFLKSIGINIPLKNITGLEDGSPQAKADWVLNKTAEGYNDFYFADDSFANVAGVKAVLDAVDVKNKVQQAKASKRRNLDKDFNRQLEQVTGKEAFKKYSDARGRLEGQQKDKGAFKRFIKQFTITPSAEDFMGLMYAFMGKGAQGNAHAKFIKENLMDPYNKAEQELISAQVSVANDFAELKKQFPNLKSKRGKNPLLEEIGVGPYTKSQAIRVYMWNKQGMDIPGMSQRDVNDLVKAVEADNELNVFADEVALIQKGEQYPAPTQTWLAGNIASDIMQGLKTGFRKKLMTEFNENADIIFSKENLNKIEAIYGSKFREALEDSLRRMKTGSNRPVFVGGGARIVNEMLDWLNSSVGAVMFFNMRSGLLQLISNVNFINWGDNNIYDAAKAFVSKDYFPTVLKLINSDYLVNRRDGLKINVNEAELTDAGRKGGVKGMINYLLDKGFAITRIMDSVAIATGGATFFINRKKSLQNRVNKDTGKLYTEAEADQQAFDDFYAIAEETQQSSNPSRISTQQASFAGRIILSFQNVTMQYNRKTKKSIQDLYNRRTKPGMTQRESDLSNLSSIIYYVGVQNLIFNAMQQALFGLAFDDEPDEDEKDKAANIVNGMADSLLFGLGFGGAIISTVKNVLMRIASESEKKTTQYRDVVWNVFDISPVLDSKVRKLRTAFKTFDWNMKEIKKRGWSIDNPAYLAVAQIISATTNLPIDRALQKLNNLRQATDEETKTWQRVALALGWSGWNFGLPYWGRQSTIDKEAKDEEKVKEKFKEDVRKAKAMGFTKRVPFTGPKSGKPNGKLGVDYVAIERYDGLIQYYKKP